MSRRDVYIKPTMSGHVHQQVRGNAAMKGRGNVLEPCRDELNVAALDKRVFQRQERVDAVNPSQLLTYQHRVGVPPDWSEAHEGHPGGLTQMQTVGVSQEVRCRRVGREKGGSQR